MATIQVTTTPLMLEMLTSRSPYMMEPPGSSSDSECRQINGSWRRQVCPVWSRKVPKPKMVGRAQLMLIGRRVTSPHLEVVGSLWLHVYQFIPDDQGADVSGLDSVTLSEAFAD